MTRTEADDQAPFVSCVALRAEPVAGSDGLLPRAAKAADRTDERWRVDRDETGALLLAAYTPQDLTPDGTVSSRFFASSAYPDNPVRHTRAAHPCPGAPRRSHMASLVPADRNPSAGPCRPGTTPAPHQLHQQDYCCILHSSVGMVRRSLQAAGPLPRGAA